MNKETLEPKVHDAIINSGSSETNDLHNSSDIVLLDIKQSVYEYISGIGEELPDEKLISYYQFLYKKYQELSFIKAEIGVSDHVWPFTELGRTMEEYRASNSIKEKTDDLLYTKLSKDVGYAIDQVSMCYYIVKKMVDERNLFKN